MTSRDRKVLTIGVVAVAVILIAGRGAPSLIRWHTDTVTLTEARADAVGRLQAQLASTTLLSDSLTWLEGASTTLAAHVLGGEDADAAHLSLVRRVTAAVVDSTVVLDSIRSMSPTRPTDSTPPLDPAADSVAAGEEEGPLLVVRARAWLVSDLAGIASVVQQIEADGRVWIEEMELRTDANPGGGPEQIRARLDVGGWRVRR